MYRRCKLEEIDLPLTKGRLDDIPMEEVCGFYASIRCHQLNHLPDQAAGPAAPMDVDGPESGTQNVYEANDYGVEVDFDELDEDEQEVCSFLQDGAIAARSR